jgi:hypothetical protein
MMKKGPGMKARLKDLLGFAHLSAKALAGFPRETPEPAADVPAPPDPRAELGVVPLGDDVGPAPKLRPPVLNEPAAPKPAWPVLQPSGGAAASASPPAPPPPPVAPPAEAPPAEPDPISTMSMIMTKPTTLRSSIEKVSIESLISPAFRSGGGDETPAPAEPAPAAEPPAPTSAWPTVGAAPPAEATPAAAASPPPPPAVTRPTRPIASPVFNDPEFSSDAVPGAAASTREAPPAETPATAAPPPAAKKPAGRAASSKIIPLPTPPARIPPPEPEAADDAESGAEPADTTHSGSDSAALARATEDFLRSSPVLGATGRRVQRGFDAPGFGDPDAIALGSMALDLERMGVPLERQPEVRARLMDLARRIEAGEFEWGALRKAVWFAMEYPALARRVMPLLLPWIDRAA